MRLFSAEAMRRADHEAIQGGVASTVLMDNAGHAVSDYAQDIFPDIDSILVLCGKGNNGGDGYIAAAYLKRAGKHVTVLELSTTPKTDDAKWARTSWLEHGEVNELNPSTLTNHLKQADLIIDGLFGSGLSRALEGDLKTLVGIINTSNTPVLSIDIPSGLSADEAELFGDVIQASYTLQLAGAKLSSHFPPANRAYGTWTTADIGISASILDAQRTATLITDERVRAFLPEREPNAHKYSVGTVLVIAGSSRYLGAAELCCRAAYRAGAGLVSLAAEDRLPSSWAEIIFEKMDWQDNPLEQLAKLDDKRARARVIGPGLDKSLEAYLPELITQNSVPTVLDAGALVGGEDWQEAVRAHGHCVLTPHMGEASRLLAKAAKTLAKNPVETAKELAEKFNAITVLKGATSVIASPDNKCFVSTRGHAGMATGGTGDVLAGIIGAFVSAGGNLMERVASAVYLHGAAGEKAAETYGNGLVASDLIAAFPASLLRIT